MAYRLTPGAPLEGEVRRIAREELASAAEGLRREKGAARDEAIHEARKSVKKVRALLRLVGGGIARRENARLRAVARKLSELRDAAAMLEVLGSLDGGDALAGVRRMLLERKRASDRKALPAVRSSAAALGRIAARTERWRLGGLSDKDIARGLKRTLRRGRRAMTRAARCAGDAEYHEWRKRVKDHWYHVRLLGADADREKQLDELSEWLGDDHNLAVLRGLLAGDSDAAAAVHLIARRQAELRERALALGEQLYAAKPRKLAVGLAAHRNR